EFFAHDFKNFPYAGRSDLFDRLARKFAIADGIVADEKNFVLFIASLNDAAAVAKFERLGLALQHAQPEREVVGDMAAADSDNAGFRRTAIAIECKIGRPSAHIDSEHSVVTLFGGRDQRTGGETGKDQFGDANVEAIDHMSVVGNFTLQAMHR